MKYIQALLVCFAFFSIGAFATTQKITQTVIVHSTSNPEQSRAQLCYRSDGYFSIDHCSHHSPQATYHGGNKKIKVIFPQFCGHHSGCYDANNYYVDDSCQQLKINGVKLDNKSGQLDIYVDIDTKNEHPYFHNCKTNWQ